MECYHKANRRFGQVKCNYIRNYIHFIGKFGSSVASYFIFLRWLCALNLFVSVLLIFFVVLPQVILCTISMHA